MLPMLHGMQRTCSPSQRHLHGVLQRWALSRSPAHIQEMKSAAAGLTCLASPSWGRAATLVVVGLGKYCDSSSLLTCCAVKQGWRLAAQPAHLHEAVLVPTAYAAPLASFAEQRSVPWVAGRLWGLC